jgi:hypothetical protein
MTQSLFKNPCRSGSASLRAGPFIDGSDVDTLGPKSAFDVELDFRENCLKLETFGFEPHFSPIRAAASTERSPSNKLIFKEILRRRRFARPSRRQLAGATLA